MHDMSSRKRGVKRLHKKVAIEAKHLVVNAKVSVHKVSKRLGIPVPVVKRIAENRDATVNPLVDNRARKPRFSKFHPRARELIEMTLKNSKTPMTLRDF